jgi:hypothetical protein
MVTLTPLIFVSKLLVLAMGIVIVRSAYRAYRRTGSRSLRALTIAFGLITVGASSAVAFTGCWTSASRPACSSTPR